MPLFISFYMWDKWGTESLSDLGKVVELMGGGAGTCHRHWSPESVLLTLYHIASQESRDGKMQQ